MRRALLAPLAVLILLLGAGVARAAAHLNLLNVESDFICTSCHEPLELVSSPQAIAEKAYLQGLINKGETLSQIKQDMVDEYGEAVLAQPPAKGFDLLIYILPPAAAVGGLLLLAYTLPRWRRRSRQIAPLEAPHPLDPADQQRLQEELERFR
jgi:cytochrome c-type biogenesis protein CcmH